MARRVGLSAIAVLVIVNVVLAVAVFRSDHTPDLAGAAPQGRPPSTAPATFDVDDPSWLVTADDGALLRAWAGTCAEPGTARLERSTDGGATFEEIALPLVTGDVPVRAILGLRATSDRELSLVGADASCGARVFDTGDGGQEWTPAEEAAGWYAAASAAEVLTPGGPADPGCDVARVAPVSDVNAKVLCSDGTVRGSNDAGDSWTFLGTLVGGVDIAFTAVADGLGLAPGDGCASAVHVTSDAGGTWAQSACVSEDGEPQALAAQRGTVYVLAGGEVFVSDDAGSTWAAAPR